MADFQFGDFSFDTQKNLLAGPPGLLKLRPKTGMVLGLLLESPNKVLTKNHIIAKLWTVEAISDGVLYECIRELRTALRDNPRKPRFIKTYPKQGYEWIHPLRREEAPRETGIHVIGSPPIRARPRLFWKLAALAMLVTILAALWTPWARLSMVRPHTVVIPNKRVAVLPFVNLTQDPGHKWVELGLRDLVVQLLDERHYLTVLPMLSTLEGLKQHQVPINERLLSPEQARLLCRDLQSQHIVETAILVADGEYKAVVSLYNEQGEAHRLEEVAAQLFDLPILLAPRIAHAFFPNLPEAAFLDRVIKDPTANRLYARGVDALYTRGPKHAEPLFEACLKEHPQFLWAKYELAYCHLKKGNENEARRLITEALEEAHEENASLKGHALILAGKIEYAQDRLERASGYFEQAHTTFRKMNHGEMVAWCLVLQGRSATKHGLFQKADQYLKAAYEKYQEIGFRHGKGWALVHFARLAIKQKRWQEAHGWIIQALHLFQEIGAMREESYCWKLLAEYAANDDRLAEVETHLRQALTIAQTVGDLANIWVIHRELGNYFRSQGLIEEARNHYLKAYDVAFGAGYFTGAERCRLLLEELQEYPPNQPKIKADEIYL